MVLAPVHLMRLPALIGSALTGLAVASLSASAATVISVGDGDTLRVEDGGKKLSIRVACIDAPEMAQSRPTGSRQGRPSRLFSPPAPRSS